MSRYVLIAWALLSAGIVARPALGSYGITEIALEEQVKAHINDRLYNTCRAVVLTRQSDDFYEGYAVFLNGRRSDLEVVISGRDIEYTFVRREASSDGREYPGVGRLDQLQVRLVEVQALADEQQAQIALLRELCERAGIDPEAAPPGSPAESPGETYESAAAPPDKDAPTGGAKDDAPQPPPSLTAKLTFTSAAYSGIRKGMTYWQVADTLGAAGEQISSSYFDGAANAVYVWTNPDDSHVCVVFRDGAALVKTQFGLPGIAPVPMPQAQSSEAVKIERFKSWQLAQDRDGRIALLGLSLGDWLESLCTVSAQGTSDEPPRIEIVEDDDEVVVHLTRQAGGDTAGGMRFYLASLPPDETRVTIPADMAVERLCVPSRMTTGDKESDSPSETWNAMRRAARPPE